jgi:hypothetical protein
LVFYYSATDQWNQPNYGWIAASAAGQVVGFPLAVSLSDGRRLAGTGCWAQIDQVPVHIVLWAEFAASPSGQAVVEKRKISAVTLDAHGIKPVSVFGLSVASGQERAALEARIPAEHRRPSPKSDLSLPECSASPPTFLLAPAGKRWTLLTGLSLSRQGAGREWPSELAKPARAQPIEISNTDPNTWPTNPAPK